MVYCVEVRAIYESPGVAPSQPRTNQRNQDEAAAASSADRYQPGGVAPSDEYLRDLDPRYGFGWECRQFVSVEATASALGGAIVSRLSGRGMRDGSKVIVFEDLRDAGSPTTGGILFQRSWPAQPTDVG